MELNEQKIFGKKDQFAIEIKSDTASDLFYVRLWFEGREVGDFSNPGEIDYLIDSFFQLSSNFDRLYEEKFDKMNDFEIFCDILGQGNFKWPLEKRNEMLERMERFGFTFGDEQFNIFTFLILNIRKEDVVRFLIYEMDNVAPVLHSFNVKTKFLFDTYKQFIRYAFENHLKKGTPFFQTGFTHDDINGD